jgi:hypothetical protein
VARKEQAAEERARPANVEDYPAQAAALKAAAELCEGGGRQAGQRRGMGCQAQTRVSAKMRCERNWRPGRVAYSRASLVRLDTSHQIVDNRTVI